MSPIKLLVAASIALPSLALAQVGANPAVPGGSQQPTTGRTSADPMTAPQDNHPGMAPAMSSITDTTTNSMTTPTTMTGDPGANSQVGEANTATKAPPGTKSRPAPKPR